MNSLWRIHSICFVFTGEHWNIAWASSDWKMETFIVPKPSSIHWVCSAVRRVEGVKWSSAVIVTSIILFKYVNMVEKLKHTIFSHFVSEQLNLTRYSSILANIKQNSDIHEVLLSYPFIPMHHLLNLETCTSWRLYQRNDTKTKALWKLVRWRSVHTLLDEMKKHIDPSDSHSKKLSRLQWTARWHNPWTSHAPSFL